MIRWHRATTEDLPALVESRIRTLRAANGLDDAADMSAVEASTRTYYERALADGSHVACLVYDGDRIIATGGVSFYQLMPTCDAPGGLHAYIMNMYTHPDYRRRGIAMRMLSLLVEEADAKGASTIALEATAQGRPLYEKFGFVADGAEMILPRV